MPPLIIAAYSPFTEDRAPVELALMVSREAASAVEAVAVLPWEMADGFVDTVTEDGTTKVVVARTMRELHEDLKIPTRVITDESAPRGLHELAVNAGAVLIAVGSTTRDRIGRVLAGSTAARLAQGAPCPIILAPHGYSSTPIETIAVGFADTPEGQTALTTAHALAADLGARLRVVGALHAAMAGDTKGRREKKQAALEQAVQALPAGVDVESELHDDDPAEILLRISADVDMLVVGSRGYGPLRSVLLGGVSRRLVTGAQCPVLILPRGVERPLADLLAAPGGVETE